MSKNNMIKMSKTFTKTAIKRFLKLNGFKKEANGIYYNDLCAVSLQEDIISVSQKDVAYKEIGYKDGYYALVGYMVVFGVVTRDFIN